MEKHCGRRDGMKQKTFKVNLHFKKREKDKTDDPSVWGVSMNLLKNKPK